MPRLNPAADKTGAPKVSQKTINEIKKMGMTDALKLVKMFADQSKTGAGATVRGEGKKFLASETAEGIRRLYGAKRFAEATGASKAAASTAKKITAPKKTTTAQGAYGKNNAPKYRPATAASMKAKKK